MTADPGTPVRQPAVDDDRAELLRALGAVADQPSDAATVAGALGLPSLSRAAHTDVFVLNCPPYASVYLGADGGLGGEAADRVAGFWRAIGLTPPSEPDHLTTLLSLYAHLGEASGQAHRASTAGHLARARHALWSEHLWPWLPGYLDAVADLGLPAATAWAELTAATLLAERAAHPAGPPPLAQRAAPAGLTGDVSRANIAAALTTPIRGGLFLTRDSLRSGAGSAGTGFRIGERRYALTAMLEQEPEQTLGWLAAQADNWSRRHAAHLAGDPTWGWWSRRAGHTARVLRQVLNRAASTAR